MMNETNENGVTKQDSAQHGDCNNKNTHIVYIVVQNIVVLLNTYAD